MKYTKQFLKELAHKNGCNLSELHKLLGVGYVTLYKYYSDRFSMTTWGRSANRKMEEAIEKFIHKDDKQAKPEPKTVSDKYVTVEIPDYESLCYQLSQGVEVFMKGSYDSLKVQDGFIVRFNKGEPSFVNPAVSLEESYYIKCPLTLDLKVGKKYLTESGEVAFVISGKGGAFDAAIIGSGLIFTVDASEKSVYNEIGMNFVEEIDD